MLHVVFVQHNLTRLRRAGPPQPARATPGGRGPKVEECAPSASREHTKLEVGIQTALAAQRIQTHMQAASWLQVVLATPDLQAKTVDSALRVSRALTRLSPEWPSARAAQHIPTHLQGAATS